MADGPKLTALGKFVIFLFLAGCFYGAYYLFSEDYPPRQAAQPGEEAAPPPLPPGTLELSIASSSTKQKWMEQVAANFHAADIRTQSGQRIQVKVTSVSSGGSAEAILDGKLKPVVWTPGSASWVAQVNEGWQQRHNKPLAGEACQSSIYTPLGLAMWRPMAEALGWPDKPIGWKTIVELVSDPQGWARHGHPEWGKFRFGHAHPKYGNSGLLTVTSFVYGIAGKTDTLSPREVYAPAVEEALRALAQNTSKYGMVTEDLVDLMVRQGPSYLHAVATYESDTVRLNLERSAELRFPVAFIFPAEGAFWGDHPYCILDQADWVDAERIEAAKLFRDFMLSQAQQALAIDKLLRPLDTDIALHAPLDLAHGTDPRVTPQSVPPLADPSGELGQAVIDLFLLTKRKSTVMLALDISGSMEGTKIRSATQATVNFLKRLNADDKVGVLIFNGSVSTLQAPTRVAEVVETLSSRVDTLLAGGNTALFEAVCQSAEMLDRERKQDQAAGENRLYGVVLLSDGDDTVGRPTENQMFATCLPANAEADGVKFFPIAFGEDANQAVLKRIADVSGGKMFAASPESIEKIYLKISAEQ
jgi:Ca-activated chloride channel family protein